MVVLHDPELLRQICKELSNERNPERVQELFSLLRSVVEVDNWGELQWRLLDLADRYPFLRVNQKQ